ncbi:Uncharacterised protein [Chryseobacterium carnipullorum]|uniref:Uncharacterized protein n=1 Tax=Chryseobacterium carnipullorum TaxID=1124835 RepID=A0A376E1I5_CHRCU|nr:Uncharacterised protein [Chryseobacterium carnipullorum]
MATAGLLVITPKTAASRAALVAQTVIIFNKTWVISSGTE